jgi:capsular exopolysaccharide synthesis family protein
MADYADRPGSPSSLEDFEGAPSHSRLRSYSLLWRHKWIVALGVAVGLAVGAIYYARTAPIYQSTASVLVVKKTPDVLPAGGSELHPIYTDDYLSTHQTLIRSPVVVANAVNRAKLGALPCFAGRTDIVHEIISALKLSREMNAGSPTSVLSIAFRGTRPDDCATVVNALAESYQQFLRTRYQNVTDETAKLIAEANDLLEKKLTTKQEEYDRFIAEHPGLWKGKEGTTSSQERLMAFEARRSALLLQEVDIRGRIGACEKVLREGRFTRGEILALVSQMQGRVGNDPVNPNMTLEERLLTLELQEKMLLEDYGPNNQQVRLVRSQLALLRSLMDRMGKRSKDAEADPKEPLRNYVEGLKLDLENTRLAVQALAGVIKTEQLEAKQMRGLEKKDEAYRVEIARSQVLFDAVAKRLDEVSILKNFTGGYEAETIAPARPGRLVYPQPVLVFCAALILGLLVGAALAYLAELSDQSFRTPEEIRRRLGLPVVGHIPFYEPRVDETAASAADTLSIDPIVCTLLHPRSSEAEAYRGVRTAVLFSSRNGGSKILQVTSPDMGDGKSTLVANLAVSLAQSGKKVLILDADFRRPRIHQFFNVEAKQGLASILSGEAELPDVVQPTPIPGLFILPCGPIPPNPAELLTQPPFQELLTYLRQQYDFVLVDSPPLLAVTDPCVVVPYVDGVLLTMRISKNARPHASRAKEMLSTLGARVIGVVVNAVGPDANGYGYAGYRYGYGYGYYNPYSDSYSSEGAGEGNGNANGAANGSSKRQRTRRAAKKRKGFLAWLLNM